MGPSYSLPYTNEITKTSELQFRALLTEDGDQEFELLRG